MNKIDLQVPVYSGNKSLIPALNQVEINVAELLARMKDNACKNLLRVYNNTVGDIAFSVDSNGWVRAQPNEEDERVWDYLRCQWSVSLPAGTYTLIYETGIANTIGTAEFRVITSTGTTLLTTNPTGEDSSYKSFTLNEKTTIGVCAKIFDGTYRFMIVDSNVLDRTYQEFFPTLKDLSKKVDTMDENFEDRVVDTIDVTVILMEDEEIDALFN